MPAQPVPVPDPPAPDGPLSGLLVVGIEQAVAAPLATRHLADLGARVIKVERPGGDFARGYDRTVHGLSSHFVWLNRGKQSVELDLKSAAGAATLHRLLARADAVVQNLAPAAAQRLGVDAATLVERFPGLVACDISGYGAGGPYAERKAYDLLIQCEAGLVSVTGTPEVPVKAGISVADIAAGMYAYSGVLAALHQRRRTGRGQALEVSMLEALGEWMGYPYFFSRYGGTDPARAGASHSTIAPYGPVPVGSGETVNLGLQNEREWERFCVEVLRRPELAGDPRFAGNAARVAHRGELDGLVAAMFAELDLDEVQRRLDRAGIAHAQQRDMTEFAAHPQLAARDRWRRVDTPAGPVEALVPPVSAGWETPMGPVPAPGEHTAAVLDWLAEDAEPRQPDADRHPGSGLAEAVEGWRPPPMVAEEVLDPWPVGALSGLLDLPATAAGPGDELPPLWHWLYFLDRPSRGELGDDGHPAEGHFLPPVPDRRRMFAGGRLRVHAPMRVGERVERRSELAGVQLKSGRSGEMVFVTVRHGFHRDGELLAVEEQDIVYRSQPAGGPRPAAPAALPAEPAHRWRLELPTDPTLLFRFSALTYNSHRIHYDQPYATGVEGYPGLVVHGPLLALLALEIPRREPGGRAVRAVDYRLVRPAFAGPPLEAVGDRDGEQLALAAGTVGQARSITAAVRLVDPA